MQTEIDNRGRWRNTGNYFRLSLEMKSRVGTKYIAFGSGYNNLTISPVPPGTYWEALWIELWEPSPESSL